MSAEVPASWLRIAGPRLTILADEAAASELTIVRTGSQADTDDHMRY
jgi:hypothetical protein